MCWGEEDAVSPRDRIKEDFLIVVMPKRGLGGKVVADGLGVREQSLE